MISEVSCYSQLTPDDFYILLFSCSDSLCSTIKWLNVEKLGTAIFFTNLFCVTWCHVLCPSLFFWSAVLYCSVIFPLLLPWFSCDPLLIFGPFIFVGWPISFLLLVPISRPEFCLSSLCGCGRIAVSHWSLFFWQPCGHPLSSLYILPSFSRALQNFFSAHTTTSLLCHLLNCFSLCVWPARKIVPLLLLTLLTVSLIFFNMLQNLLV